MPCWWSNMMTEEEMLMPCPTRMMTRWSTRNSNGVKENTLWNADCVETKRDIASHPDLWEGRLRTVEGRLDSARLYLIILWARTTVDMIYICTITFKSCQPSVSSNFFPHVSTITSVCFCCFRMIITAPTLDCFEIFCVVPPQSLLPSSWRTEGNIPMPMEMSSWAFGTKESSWVALSTTWYGNPTGTNRMSVFLVHVFFGSIVDFSLVRRDIWKYYKCLKKAKH